MIDPEEDKRLNLVSAVKYLSTRRFKVENFLDERIRHEDKPLVLQELLKNPVSLAYIIKYNYEMSESQRIHKVVEKIIKEGNITIMIGAKGHGKTATSVWLMDYINKKFDKKVYWFGYNEALKKHYPFIKLTYNLTDPDENSFLVFDETALFLFSRDFMAREQKQRIKELPTLRHRGCSILFISQSSNLVDIDLFMLSDYIWFKPYFVTELDTRLNLPSWLKYCLPQNPKENLIYDMNLECIYTFNNPLPPYWDDSLSKPFSKIKTKEEAIDIACEMAMMGFSKKEIEQVLRIRGWNMEDLNV